MINTMIRGIIGNEPNHGRGVSLKIQHLDLVSIDFMWV